MTIVDFEKTKKADSGSAEPAGTVSRKHYDETVAALKQYKSSTGTSWDDIATQVGYASSTLNLFATGKYPIESSAKVIGAVETFLAQVEERTRLITQPTFVLTSLSKRMLAIVKKAVLLRKIAVIAAASGTSKTTTLMDYWRRTPRSIYFKANPSFIARGGSRTWPVVRKLVAELTSASPAASRQPECYDMIVQALRGTGRLLVIDEAQLLSSEALDLVRCIHEEADIPVVLAGNEELYEYGHGGGGSKASFAQFQSRALREQFATSDIKPTDVGLIAEQLVGVDVARDAETLLLDQARRSGGFRRLVTVLQIAQTLRTNNGSVKKAHVVAAIQDLDGGER